MTSRLGFLGLALVVTLGRWGFALETLELIRKIPHSGYSEGIDYHDNFIWHSLPKQLLKIDPKDGTVLARWTPPTEYAESLMWFKGELWNVSFHDNSIYKGKLKDGQFEFTRVGNTPEEKAWGITHDNKSIIMTGNFSDKLYFLDPVTLKVKRTLTVPVKDIEDLAWDGQGIWASSFSRFPGQVFRINPKNGQIQAFYQIPEALSCPIIDGIAYDGQGLWITGKECPSIFYVKKPTERTIAKK